MLRRGSPDPDGIFTLATPLYLVLQFFPGRPYGADIDTIKIPLSTAGAISR